MSPRLKIQPASQQHSTSRGLPQGQRCGCLGTRESSLAVRPASVQKPSAGPTYYGPGSGPQLSAAMTLPGRTQVTLRPSPLPPAPQPTPPCTEPLTRLIQKRFTRKTLQQLINPHGHEQTRSNTELPAAALHHSFPTQKEYGEACGWALACQAHASILLLITSQPGPPHNKC